MTARFARPEPRTTRVTPLPQPKTPAWSEALAPSQRRAAEARAAIMKRRSAQRWLRTITPR